MGSKTNDTPIDCANEEKFYEVECIRSHKGSMTKRLYEIKWKGYPESDNTWEPIENLQTMLKQVGDYEEGLKLDRRTATAPGYNNSKNVHKMNSQSVVQKAQKNQFMLLQKNKKTPKKNRKQSKIQILKEVPHCENNLLEVDQPKKSVSEVNNGHQDNGENQNKTDNSMEINKSTHIQDDEDSITKSKLNTSRAIIVIHKRKQCQADSDINSPVIRKKTKYTEIIENETISKNEIGEITPKKNKLTPISQATLSIQETGNQQLDEELSQFFHPHLDDFGSQSNRVNTKKPYFKMERSLTRKKQSTETDIYQSQNTVQLDPEPLLEKNKPPMLESYPSSNLDKMEDILKQIESLLDSQISHEEPKTAIEIEPNDDNTKNKENVDLSQVQKQGIQPEQIRNPLILIPELQQQIRIGSELILDYKKISIDNNNLKTSERQERNQVHLDDGKDPANYEDCNESNVLMKEKKLITPDQNSSSQQLENVNLSCQISGNVEQQIHNLSEHQNIAENIPLIILESDNLGSSKDIQSPLIRPEIQTSIDSSVISQKIPLQEFLKSNGNYSKLQSMLDQKGEQGGTQDRRNKLQTMLAIQEIKKSIPIQQVQKPEIHLENERLFKLLSRESERYHMELVANSLRKDIEGNDCDVEILNSSNEDKQRKKDKIFDISKDLKEYKGLSGQRIKELKTNAKIDLLAKLEKQIHQDRFLSAKIKEKLFLNHSFLSLDFKQINTYQIPFSNPKKLIQNEPHSLYSSLSYQTKGCSVTQSSQNCSFYLEEKIASNNIEKQKKSIVDLTCQDSLQKDHQKSGEYMMIVGEQIQTRSNTISRQEQISKNSNNQFKKPILSTQNGSMRKKKDIIGEKERSKLHFPEDKQQFIIIDDQNETTNTSHKQSHGLTERISNENNSSRQQFIVLEENDQTNQIYYNENIQNPDEIIEEQKQSIEFNNTSISQQHDMHIEYSPSSFSKVTSLLDPMNSLQSNCYKEQNELNLDGLISPLVQENEQQKCQDQQISQVEIIPVSTNQKENMLEEEISASESNYSNTSNNINEFSQDQDNQQNDISTPSTDQQSPGEILAQGQDEITGNQQLTSISLNQHIPQDHIHQKTDSEKPIEFEMLEKDINNYQAKKQFIEEFNLHEELDPSIRDDRDSKHKDIHNLLQDQQQENNIEIATSSLPQENKHQESKSQKDQFELPSQATISNSLQNRVNALSTVLEDFQGLASCKVDSPQSILSHIVFQGQIFLKVSWKPRLKGNNIAVQMMPSYIEQRKLQKLHTKLLNQYIMETLCTLKRQKKE